MKKKIKWNEVNLYGSEMSIEDALNWNDVNDHDDDLSGWEKTLMKTRWEKALKELRDTGGMEDMFIVGRDHNGREYGDEEFDVSSVGDNLIIDWNGSENHLTNS